MNQPTHSDNPQLPPGWYWAPLAKGLIHRKEFVTIEDNALYKRVTVQLHGRGIVHRDDVYGFALTTKQQQIIKTDDFLVAEIDAKVGGFGIVPAHLEGGIVSSHYFTFVVVQDVLLPGFLNAFIETGYITSQILQFVRGSLNYAAIRPKHILGIEFPFAPRPVQERTIKEMALPVFDTPMGRMA